MSTFELSGLPATPQEYIQTQPSNVYYTEMLFLIMFHSGLCRDGLNALYTSSKYNINPQQGCPNSCPLFITCFSDDNKLVNLYNILILQKLSGFIQ